MLPRKKRLLLSVGAGTLAAGALLATAGCSSSTATGSVTQPPDAAGPCNGGPCGSVAVPIGDGGDAGDEHPDPVGVVAIPPDGGDQPEAGTGPCGGHPCGSIAVPPDAGDAAVMGKIGHSPYGG